MHALSLHLLLALSACLPRAAPKFTTIEPCSSSGACSALVGYTLYTNLKVSEVATLFGVDPISLLLANAVDISIPGVENHILPSQLFLRVPVQCACVNGIRQAVGVTYTTSNPILNTLVSISDTVYGALVSPEQILFANPRAGISDSAGPVTLGTQLTIPLPCTCFNNTDNNLPAVYMSYVVQDTDTLSGIAARYLTTVTDLMNVNSMSSPVIGDGDVRAIPLSACASNFPTYAKDYGLVVPNGTYAISANKCVQCSCGIGSRNLFCEPSPLSVSCSSMQCSNSSLMIGNVTAQQTTGGCSVTSCDYGGFVNGSILTMLSTSLQPRCPGPQQLPPLIAPPTTIPESSYSPAPAPSEPGAIPPSTSPRSSTVPSSGVSIGLPPAHGPTRSTPFSSGACSLTGRLARFLALLLVLGLTVELVL